MNRDRLIGVIMIGLILLIVIMFLSHRMNIEQLENQKKAIHKTTLTITEEMAEIFDKWRKRDL